jgi:hypothetical protein
LLENEHGTPLPPILSGKGKEHWRVLAALLVHPALEAPLRAAAKQHINDVLAAHPTAAPGTVRISSTAAGPAVLGRLPAGWGPDYAHWLADLRRRQPDLPAVDAGQMHGLLLWQHFAAVRPERWQVAMEDGERFYILLDARGA